jgi:DNA-binding transcriptional regulator YhcF (GntR family)
MNTRLILPIAQPIVTNRLCDCNEAVALNSRHLQSNEDRALDDIPMIKEAFELVRKQIPVREHLPYSRQLVLSRKKGGKFYTYQRALESLKSKPITECDATLKMFIKNERMSDPDKAPRAIQARNPRYNLELQTYINVIEDYVFHLPIDKAVSTKCYDQDRKAQCLKFAWDEFAEPVAILADHSRFDSRIHSEWLKAEHEYYKSFFPGDDYLSWLLKFQLHNHGATRNGVSYSIRGSRASGDANTSIGNSIVNLAIIAYWLKGIRYRVLVDGDDSVIIIEASDLHKVDMKRLEGMGFGTTTGLAYEFEEIDFCQCKPVLCADGWRMVRNPQRVIDRSTVCIDANYTRLDLFKRWLRSVGECELSINRGVPVLQSFAKFLIRCSDRSITLRDVDMTNRKSSRDYSHVITEDARRSFAKAFHMSIGQQIDFENYFDKLVLTADVIDKVSEPTCNTSVLLIQE